MKIKADLSNSYIEKLLSDLKDKPEDFEQLLVPTNLKDMKLGNLVSFCQFIITWANTCTERVVQTYAQGPDQILSFSSTLHGIMFSVFSKRLLDFEKNEIRDECNKIIGNIILEDLFKCEGGMPKESSAFYRGPNLLLPCIDKSTLPFIPQLYSNGEPGSVKTEKDMLSFTKKIIARRFSGPLEERLKSLEGEINSIIYETFLNTHEHARPLSKSNRIERQSVRGLLAFMHPLESIHQIDSLIGDYAPLSELKGISKDRLNANSTFRILELSIFDSGLGLAPTISGRNSFDMSKEDEIRETNKCFNLHETSKHKEGFGIGLARVISLIKKLNGFVKVRTGNISLYKSYITETSNLIQDDFKLDLVDGVSFAQGTTITILIPMEK